MATIASQPEQQNEKGRFTDSVRNRERKETKQRDTRERTRVRKLLSRILDPPEIEIVFKVWEAEVFCAGRLGVAESLLKRGWLERSGRTVRLSEQTKQLLAERGT